MWFIFSIITFLSWGAADLFYKKGAVTDERYSHLKTSATVGIVMGITAIATLIIKGVDYDPRNLLIYLPVSAMYILSMTVGYFGLRYLELSISSPVQNASGAFSCILLIIVLGEIPDLISAVAIVLIAVGVIMLGRLEKSRSVPSAEYADVGIGSGKKYRTGVTAIIIPIIYCIIDSLGTFMDGYYLDSFETTPLAGVTEQNYEDVANISYELTFFIVALIILVYICVIKKEKFTVRMQGNRITAAVFETAGQFAYVYALSGNPVVSAPIVASYCVVSAVLAGIFLSEKLTRGQYIAVVLVVLGIIMLGINEGMSL